ncbi:MAG: conjugative transfer system coupling protein TraD, partial [Saprospiraceae bacterium]
MKYDSMAYENPWRTNYESQAASVWVMAATVSFGVNQLANLPPEPFYWMGGICSVMALSRMPQAIRLATLQKHLRGRPLEFIQLKKLTNYMNKNPDAIWLGYGFMWENRHAQRVFEILKRDWSEIVNNSTKRATDKQMGQTWIHGVEPKEQKIHQSISHSEGQNLIVGTTGSGKTRLFDLLISQAIMRNEAVIIIDPKGDKEMKENARIACEASGNPGRFVQFHPAFPEESARIDPLRNFTRVTEIASRLAALIPSEAGADPFKSFGWQALNNISQALVMAYERPNLVLLKRFLESGPQQMVVKATVAYAERNIEDGGELANKFLNESNASSLDKKARAMSKFYENVIQPQAPSPELEALISMFHHDKTHFSKMVANLLPIMNMLTAGELGQLLSPDYMNVNDTRLITDNKKIIDNAQVAYIGLDSLTDSTVGSAIGSIILSDLVAVAGDRYNFGVGNRPVNIFVDEASEVIN